jgi:hypothetical protein
MCIILKILGLVEKADKEKVFYSEAKNGNEKRRKEYNISYFQKKTYSILLNLAI